MRFANLTIACLLLSSNVASASTGDDITHVEAPESYMYPADVNGDCPYGGYLYPEAWVCITEI